MKARVATWLVHFISLWLDDAFHQNYLGNKRAERFFGRGFKLFDRRLLPLAQHLDKEAAVDQMIAECWWG